MKSTEQREQELAETFFTNLTKEITEKFTQQVQRNLPQLSKAALNAIENYLPVNSADQVGTNNGEDLVYH